MTDLLKDLQPNRLWHHFESLTRIPRESGNEKAVSDFLTAFAKGLGLDVIQEPSMNVIIKKKASTGYENHKTVIIQGHMDMVCVKEDDLEFDFGKDPIPLVIDGDLIKTKGTTLGADNGIAVAMAMAILEDKTLVHPPLQVLITIAEETGMDGVMALDPANITGDILINLDSEEEGVLLSSCAGGVNNIITLPITKQAASYDTAFKIVIKGLLGGHSGVEIHKRRANAIVCAGRLLYLLKTKLNFEIAGIHGGDKPNAIPKRSEVVVICSKADTDLLRTSVSEIEHLLKNEVELSDAEVTIELQETELPVEAYDHNSAQKTVQLLMLLPDAVQTMSAGIEGLVESSINLGILDQNEQSLVFTSAVRSSVASLKDMINQKIGLTCDLIGADMRLESDYPSWPFKAVSETRELMKEVYEEMFSKSLKVDALHAGLECGFLIEKVGDIDMVSLGPDLNDVHTPKENLSISSTKRVYDFLLEVLTRI
ncbi:MULTISPECIES: aminoacyl-histidine dipeptidase [unclassified Fusibacter]|uniref:aminoacyl-histidine dipeptidase n=1 Tax=unclassified Fusibacter TaxID=2624464 RepID=UPI001011A2C8|nr:MULTISPECIES: aminoacyl-histidine dipeptidase [unclassified Fusibacter]MCK8058571.1 aminoacyl-histidine dipeptidase [Fusibacter sp. A2]NPE22659.1 aminoacyl-histidine dipeptidase [Fusibacter sp. A1]RXV60222.1 aminoacyl-histidine dipeptidase [Fusibacter sp. A1]